MGPFDATQLLRDGRAGDGHALDRLFDHVHAELRCIAGERLRRHRRGETLSTSAMVDEVYHRLVVPNGANGTDRAHFFALASRAMRFILVDYARVRLERSRDATAADVPVDAVQVAADERATDLIALHEALEVLAQRNERLGRMVEYRFFGGLTFEEIAEVTGCPVPTVKRDWSRARAWLYRTMQATVA
jgi:RNA polymerase sigma factor (TIGR02999 family)